MSLDPHPSNATRRGPTHFASLLVLALLAIASAAAAQGPPDDDALRWSLGLGVISSPRPYVGADNDTQVVPLIDLQYKRFYVRGIRTGFDLVKRESLELDLFARVQFGGFEADDSPFLAGMEERERTVELGVSATRPVGPLELSATVAADALGRSNGLQAEIDLTWPKVFGRGRAGIFPSVGIVWQSDDFVDYYAGVRPAEARPGRPAYEGEAAVSLVAGLGGFASLTPRAQLIWQLQGERFDDAFENSPIIDDRWGYFGLFGVAFRF